ncbi:MAG: nucleotidyltransferase domain-containing protein [Bacteroidota bacterium]
MDKSHPHIPYLLKSHLKEICALCKKHHVSKLWVFGSVLTPHFKKDSDIDFLYEWNEEAITPANFLNNLWTLLDKLEELLGHSVDWIYAGNLKNPYFIEEIEETKVLLYVQERNLVPA